MERARPVGVRRHPRKRRTQVIVLREPSHADNAFICECFADWIAPDRYRRERGVEWRASPAKVEVWINRWQRPATGEECFIVETEQPVGLVSFRKHIFTAMVDNLAIHPQFRGLGYSTELLRMLKAIWVKDGIVAAEFETTPGIIRDQLGTRYEDLGNGRGRMTWDREI